MHRSLGKGKRGQYPAKQGTGHGGPGFPFFFLEKKENTVNIQRGQELGMEGTSFFCLGFFSDCGLQMAKP